MSFSPPKKIQAESESLDQYLREISAYPLIDRDAECRLAGQIREAEQTKTVDIETSLSILFL